MLFWTIIKFSLKSLAGNKMRSILAMLGMAMLWYIGLHTDVWW